MPLFVVKFTTGEKSLHREVLFDMVSQPYILDDNGKRYWVYYDGFNWRATYEYPNEIAKTYYQISLCKKVVILIPNNVFKKLPQKSYLYESLLELNSDPFEEFDINFR
jgi:hypothetical protein